MQMGGIRLVLAITMLLLSGCAVAEEVNATLFDTTKVNLADSSYAATDMLAPQAKSRITQNTPIRMSVITDVATPNEVTPFGTQLSNQISSRLVQLGYNVQSVPVPSLAQSGGPAVLTPPTYSAAPKPTQGAVKPELGRGGDCVVGGTYTRLKHSILVSLRIVQAPDQRIIAAYDYTIQKTSELDDLSISTAERQERSTKFLGVPVNNN